MGHFRMRESSAVDFLIPVNGKAADICKKNFGTALSISASNAFKNGFRAGMNYILIGQSIPRLYGPGSAHDFDFRIGAFEGAAAARGAQS